MNTTDYYATLGVLPQADPVVITAAYRAIAQRYHPDKSSGDSREAHERMSRINEAYETLRDPVRRAEYDRVQQSQDRGAFEEDDSASQSDAFDSALRAAEEKWGIACSIYPDLRLLRAGLSKVSTSLAFAYVTGLLQSKSFDKRHELAAGLEHNFLSRYFGTNEQILRFSKELILSGHRDAAKALNQLVDVIGSNAEASLLVAKIERDFGFKRAREHETASRVERGHFEQLVHVVRALGYYEDARELAELLDFKTEEVGGGFFAPAQVRVTSKSGDVLNFKNPTEFVHWATNTLCDS